VKEFARDDYKNFLEENPDLQDKAELMLEMGLPGNTGTPMILLPIIIFN